MKKIVLILTIIISCAGSTFAMYDFNEPLDEYMMFKDYYDLRTEYWRYIPNHLYYEKAPDIKFKDINNKKPNQRTVTKQSKSDNGGTDSEIIIK